MPEESPRRERILTSTALVSGSSWMASLFAAARGVLFASLLGPQGYGLWSFMSAWQSLSVHGDLGVLQVASRDLAARADDSPRLLRGMGWTTVAWDAASALLAGAVAIVVGPLLWQGGFERQFLLFPLLFLGVNMLTTAQGVSRGLFRFREAAIVVSVVGAVALITGSASAAVFGTSGLIVSQAFTYGAAGLALIVSAGLGGPSFTGGREWLTAAIRDGWRLLLPGLALQAFVSLDVVMAGRLIGAVGTGQYSIALLGSAMVAGVIAGSVAAVVGQHVIRSFAVVGHAEDRLVWGPPAWLAVVLAPACALAALVVPVLIRALLPEYAEAASLVPLLMTAAFFLHTQFGYSSTFVAAGVPMRSVPLYLSLIVVNVVFDVLIVRAGYGLPGIAVGTLLVNVAMCAAHPILVWRTVGGRLRWQQVLGTLLAGAVPAAVAAVSRSAAAAALLLALGSVGWWMTLTRARVEAPLPRDLSSRVFGRR